MRVFEQGCVLIAEHRICQAEVEGALPFNNRLDLIMLLQRNGAERGGNGGVRGALGLQGSVDSLGAVDIARCQYQPRQHGIAVRLVDARRTQTLILSGYAGQRHCRFRRVDPGSEIRVDGLDRAPVYGGERPSVHCA